MAENNIVAEYRIGNTRIKIADDYCRERTQDDIDCILKRITQNAISYVTATENKQRGR